jgi:hypothetical protein
VVGAVLDAHCGDFIRCMTGVRYMLDLWAPHGEWTPSQQLVNSSSGDWTYINLDRLETSDQATRGWMSLRVCIGMMFLE